MDPAGGTSSSADFTAIGLFAVTPDNFLLLLHMDRTRTAFEEIQHRLKEVCEGWPLAYVLAESALLQKAIVRQARRLPGLPPIREVNPADKGNKLVRAIPALVAVEGGQVRFRDPTEAEWWDDFQTELLAFTGKDGDRDDQVDVLAYAVMEWQTGPAAAGAEPKATGGYSGPASVGISGGGYRGHVGMPSVSSGGYRRPFR
jgi:predicted phage terminase large subunit-like protein